MEARSATLSDDGLYRYTLSRDWPTLFDEQAKGRVLWVLLNPSTADGQFNDATTNRCRGFSQQWGYSGMTLVNPFAYKAKKPAELAAAMRAGVDVIGPDNPRHLREQAAVASLIVAGWGASYPLTLAGHVREHRRWLVEAGAQCLGYTNTGEPRHPLYVPGTTALVPLSMDGAL